MAYFQHQNVHFHYVQEGPSLDSNTPIITLHGLAQNTHYWTDTGVSTHLAKHYPVINLDMRGHGLTRIEGEPKGYDVKVLVEDINALAKHLGIERFHLMGHSTGGMVAAHYAMKYATQENSPLASLLLCNTSSSIMFSKLPKAANEAGIKALAYSFEHLTWKQMLRGLQFQPGPLFQGLSHGKDPDALFAKALAMMEHGDGHSIAEFIRNFYNDPDYHEAELEKISCPVLVVTAELDPIFTKTGDILVKHIANVHHEHAAHIGHMTALEDPVWFNDVISKFLQA